MGFWAEKFNVSWVLGTGFEAGFEVDSVEGFQTGLSCVLPGLWRLCCDFEGSFRVRSGLGCRAEPGGDICSLVSGFLL